MNDDAVEVANFLNWFRSNAEPLLFGADSSAASTAGAELSRRLDELGITIWEAGPYDESGDTSFLALSKHNISVRGASNRALILEGEPPPGWLFVGAKPRKYWDRLLLWGMAEIPIDASEWRFNAYKYPDGKFDLVMCSDVPEIDDDDELLRLVLLVLESELGESILDELINVVEISPSNVLPDNKPSVAIADLRQIVQ